MSQIVWEKQCKCHPATASGPRLIQHQHKVEGDTVSVTMQMVPLACDVCDTPWTLRAASLA